MSSATFRMSCFPRASVVCLHNVDNIITGTILGRSICTIWYFIKTSSNQDGVKIQMHFSNMLRIKTETEKQEDDERCKTDASTHILDSSLCAGDVLNFSAIKELLVSFLISLLPPHTFPVWLGWPFPSCNGFLNHGDIFFIKRASTTSAVEDVKAAGPEWMICLVMVESVRALDTQWQWTDSEWNIALSLPPFFFFYWPVRSELTSEQKDLQAPFRTGLISVTSSSEERLCTYSSLFDWLMLSYSFWFVFSVCILICFHLHLYFSVFAVLTEENSLFLMCRRSSRLNINFDLNSCFSPTAATVCRSY